MTASVGRTRRQPTPRDRARAAARTRLWKRLGSVGDFVHEFGLLARSRSLKSLAQSVQRDDIAGIAAEVAYYAVLALFPFLLFVAALIGTVAVEPAAALGHLFRLMHRFLPTSTAAMVFQYIEGPMRANTPLLLSFGFLAVLWTGSRGIEAAFRAVNRVYGSREKRRWLHQQALALAMMLLIAVALLMTILVMGGSDLYGVISSPLAVPPAVAWLWRGARWVVLCGIASAVLGWFYSVAPFSGRRTQWITPGGTVAALSWLLANALFATYVDWSKSYARLYGPIGDMVVLMLWTYVGAYCLLLGAEINVTIVRAMEQEQAARASPRES